MERLNPGLVVFAGPFQIQSGDLELRKLEIDACAKMKAEFKKAGVPVKVVLNCDGAWVLRARDGLRTNLEEYKEKIKTRTASPRRAWGIKKGDDGV